MIAIDYEYSASLEIDGYGTCEVTVSEDEETAGLYLEDEDSGLTVKLNRDELDHLIEMLTAARETLGD